MKRFTNLDKLINSGYKEIVLDSDFTLGDEEESEYIEGIELDLDDIKIDGNGHTIDARGKAKIFKFNDKRVTLKNIKFINGNANQGGVIYQDNGKLIIKDCVFKDNKSKYGGAIYADYGRLKIIKSVLKENESKYGGQYTATLEISRS